MTVSLSVCNVSANRLLAGIYADSELVLKEDGDGYRLTLLLRVLLRACWCREEKLLEQLMSQNPALLKDWPPFQNAGQLM